MRLSGYEEIFNYLFQTLQPGKMYAFDGLSGSGKTFFVEKMKRWFRGKDKNISTINVDWFIADRETRNKTLAPYFKLEKPYPKDFLDRTALYSLLNAVLTFLNSEEEEEVIEINRVYNRATQRKDGGQDLYLNKKDVVICEGFLAIDNYTKNLFASTFFFVVDDETGFANIMKREQQKDPSHRNSKEEIALRRKWFDNPLGRRHFTKYRQVFDYLVDTRIQEKPMLIYLPQESDLSAFNTLT